MSGVITSYQGRDNDAIMTLTNNGEVIDPQDTSKIELKIGPVTIDSVSSPDLFQAKPDKSIRIKLGEAGVVERHPRHEGGHL